MKRKIVLEIEKVNFSYGCHLVLEEVGLTVLSGESVGITGPNGSGKSTLLKLVAGLLKPLNGSIKIFGQDLRDYKNRERISYVAQRAGFFNSGFPSTVEEVVLSGRTVTRGLFRPLNMDDREIAGRALAETGLYDYRRKPIGSLSGGQQQRVFIARALAGQPDLLLLDEPTAGMDPEAQANFYTLLKELVTKKGLTLLLVSHDLAAVSTVVDRQVCLDKHLCSCCQHPVENVSLSFRDCKKRLWTA